MANEIVSGKQESGSTNNVLHHPSFGHAPVKNIKAPGRKKGTASLHAARYKRWMKEQQPANPEPQSVQLPKPEQGKFFYPKAMLSQAYFCLGGTGIWSTPRLNLSMLADTRFVSPMPYIKVGRLVRYRQSDLEAFLRGRTVEAVQ